MELRKEMLIDKELNGKKQDLPGRLVARLRFDFFVSELMIAEGCKKK